MITIQEQMKKEEKLSLEENWSALEEEQKNYFYARQKNMKEISDFYREAGKLPSLRSEQWKLAEYRQLHEGVRNV